MDKETLYERAFHSLPPDTIILRSLKEIGRGVARGTFRYKTRDKLLVVKFLDDVRVSNFSCSPFLPYKTLIPLDPQNKEPLQIEWCNIVRNTRYILYETDIDVTKNASIFVPYEEIEEMPKEKLIKWGLAYGCRYNSVIVKSDHPVCKAHLQLNAFIDEIPVKDNVISLCQNGVPLDGRFVTKVIVHLEFSEVPDKEPILISNTYVSWELCNGKVTFGKDCYGYDYINGVFKY